MMKVFGLSDKGKFRPDNQDTFAFRRLGDGVLAVVCDGMGGAAAGVLASDIACKGFISFMETAMLASGGKNIAENLRAAADMANLKVYERSMEDEACRGMGTTLVAAYLSQDTATILNVGDSQAYRVSDRKLIKLTHDHSVVQEMVDSGQITSAQARRHPHKNVITRAIGGESAVRSDIFEADVKENDVFFLCSDGLTSALDEKSILNYCVIFREPEDICRALIDAALEKGARDNVTIVAVTIENGGTHIG